MLIPAPLKTPVGFDELRNRTRGLGQRYRTILLLVDGHRPLGEVLAMAQGAGALTTHFEELVRLGMVELPSNAMAPDPRETSPSALDAIRVTSVEVDVPVLALSDAIDANTETATPPVFTMATLAAAGSAKTATPPVRLPAHRQAKPSAAPRELAMASPHAEALFRNLAEVVSSSHADTAWPTADRLAQARAAAAQRRPNEASFVSNTVPGSLLKVPSVVPAAMAILSAPRAKVPKPLARSAPLLKVQIRETALTKADHARPPPQQTEEQLLQRVREILVNVLRLDGPLTGSFSAARVQATQSTKELIELVWEIERQRGHARRSRPQLFALQRARELLGMGNTQVAVDTQFGLPDD